MPMLACRAVKTPVITMVFGLLAVVAGVGEAAQVGGDLPADVVDRIVAVVDEDPILASDLDRTIGLGLISRLPNESEKEFRRRTLDLILEERLRAHEVDRFGFTEISLSEVEAALETLIATFPSRQAFLTRIEELGLSLDDVRQIVARQVMVITYVDERLGSRVFVSLDDIREYYDSVLASEMARRNQPLPPLIEVREDIRRVIREQRLNQEIERWTSELRLEADIEDYFEPDSAEAEVVLGVARGSSSG